MAMLRVGEYYLYDYDSLNESEKAFAYFKKAAEYEHCPVSVSYTHLGIATVVEFLQKKGYTVEANPNTKISEEQYAICLLYTSSVGFVQSRNCRLENPCTD